MRSNPQQFKMVMLDILWSAKTIANLPSFLELKASSHPWRLQ